VETGPDSSHGAVQPALLCQGRVAENLAQAFDFRAPTPPSPACQAAYEAIRKHVATLEEDRPLFNDINALTKATKAGEILAAVENVTGALK
jgi:hypothetical protein